MFVAELRRRIPGSWNVGCYSIHPGNVMTEVVRTLPLIIQKAYRIVMQKLLLTVSEGGWPSLRPLPPPSHVIRGFLKAGRQVGEWQVNHSKGQEGHQGCWTWRSSSEWPLLAGRLRAAIFCTLGGSGGPSQ